MTITNIQVTFYKNTGYSFANEPASDSVVNMNETVVMSASIREKNPWKLDKITVQVSESNVIGIDYIKVEAAQGRWYYYVLGHESPNDNAVIFAVSLDYFATVGLSNINFFGNIVRRSLSASEALNYPLLPEPWAPRRPLKTRRVLLDLNVNKSERLPSRITTVFEDGGTSVNRTETIQVPNNLIVQTTTPDSLTVSASMPMIYPNAAGASSHTITTPWGNIAYTTPYEQYFQLSGTALSTFLANAKKSNSLELLSNPYYLPNPARNQTVQITELQNSSAKNLKASKHYLSLTIRSLAANSTRTFSDNDTALSASQSITVIIVPDKDGGIYVIPATIRDTGLTAYTYLEGVYSPFETVMYNAVGDTPAKFASDGTIAMNQGLSNLFQTYANKINALEYENMQANYFKDVMNSFGVAAGLAITVLGTTSDTTGTSKTIGETNPLTTIDQTTTTSGSRQSIGTTANQVKNEGSAVLETPDNQYMTWNGLETAIFGAHQNDVHKFMLGNINDYLNRWASIQNDIHNGKVSNLFKNITIVGNYGDTNKLAGKYEILIASLQPEDEANFDLFLQHFGHAVDEYSGTLVPNVNTNYNYVMVGDDAILTNTVRADANTPILSQFRTGVRVWKTLIRPENI